MRAKLRDLGGAGRLLRRVAFLGAASLVSIAGTSIWRANVLRAAFAPVDGLAFEPLLGQHAGDPRNHQRAVNGDVTPRPNIIVIQTDDQDVAAISVMPRVRSLLAQQGITFDSFFAADPLCSPSRASFLTGQYPHNHGVLSNKLPLGGYSKLDHSQTIAVWLQDSGYYTVAMGKYLNQYGLDDANPNDGIPACKEIPPGWDEWYSTVTVPGGNPAAYYYNFPVNENGQLIAYGSKTPNLGTGCSFDQIAAKTYNTDLFAQKAETLINQRAMATDGKPFFMLVNFYAPHKPSTPAPRHAGLYGSAPLPTPASLNEADVSDKPAYIQAEPLLSARQIALLTTEYRQRLESLQAVDEAVDRMMTALGNTDQLVNTVVIFTSDNGHLLGEHRRTGKTVPYEESIRMSLVVRGPGFLANAVLNHLTSGIDLAPTILELAQTTAPEGVTLDGASLVPLLGGQSPTWRTAMLFENQTGTTPSYGGVHDMAYVYIEHSTGEQELYDLQADRYQLASEHDNPAYGAIKSALQAKLSALEACAGSTCWQ